MLNVLWLGIYQKKVYENIFRINRHIIKITEYKINIVCLCTNKMQQSLHNMKH